MSTPAPKEGYLPYLEGPDPNAGPRPLAAVLSDLRQPVHESLLESKKKGGQEITFISWHTAARILDKYAPGWQYSQPVVTLSADGHHVVVSVQIGILTSDYGWVWRGATGWDEDDPKAYGEASDRAESAALRRAAAKFGLCLYLYYEHGAGGPTQRAPKGPATPTGITAPARKALAPSAEPAAPPAQSDDWDQVPPAAISAGQRQAIAALLRQADMGISSLCSKLSIESLDDLSAVRAAKTIDWLQERARRKQAAPVAAGATP